MLSMAVEVKRRKNESPNTLIYRFIKKVQQTGVLREAKKRRFQNRRQNRSKRRISALHRNTRKQEIERLRKLGEL